MNDKNFMEYNSQRKYLIIPEYGRKVQDLIEFAKTIEDRELRNKAAKDIIRQMMLLQQSTIKDAEELDRKLWDHLFIISNFEIDVDAPYPKPDIKEAKEYSKLYYNSDKRKMPYRYYGHIITDMINKAVEMEDGEEKKSLIIDIANNMKKLYLTWNKGVVDDKVIYEHLSEMSNGKIKIDNETELTNSWNFTNQSSSRRRSRSSKPPSKNFHKKNNR